MANYIIKIDCTNKEKLVLNDKKITRDGMETQNPTDLALGYLVSIFPYIESVAIVHIKIAGFTKRFLYFFCYNENELSDAEFINFIGVLKNIGFIAQFKNAIISYVKISNIGDNYRHSDILKYNYNSEEKLEVDSRPRNPYHYKYGNYTYTLKICKNISV